MVGCSALFPFKYTYKTSDRHPIFALPDIRKNPVVGVALLSDNGTHGAFYIKAGIQKFINSETKEPLEYEVLFPNIGADILIDDNFHITNIDSMRNKYPDMRYVFVTWKSSPVVKRNKNGLPREIKSNGKTKTVWDDEYTTTMSINSELLLFDLYARKVLAKAIKTISTSETYTSKYEEPRNDTVFQVLEVLSFLSSLDDAPKDYYPKIYENSIEWKFEDYVYEFIANLN